MRCFTISSGTVSAGIQVDKFHLKGVDVTIDAIVVGDAGRGRELGVLPVDSLAFGRALCEKAGNVYVYPYTVSEGGRPRDAPQTCHLCSTQYGNWVRTNDNGYEKWTSTHPMSGQISEPLRNADLGTTQAGKPKLVRETKPDDSRAIVCFRTKIGFRGGNDHTGDRLEWRCGPSCAGRVGPLGEIPEVCPVCNQGTYMHRQWTFREFPGQILCRGVVAQGTAGRMGSGAHIVAVIPAGVVFRTGYLGRLYGAPSAHYYVFDGEKILSATWKERTIVDIF